jgi:glycine oxidase
MNRETDCCIIGGGVVGLSIARELAGRGLRVTLLARDQSRDTASWAAAGIFPPAPAFAGGGPGDALTTWSDSLHRTWAAELRAETDVDNELRRCGGLHVGGSADHLARLRAAASDWQRKGAACEWLAAADVARLEPALVAAVDGGVIGGGFLLPDEMSIRPPRHLEALTRSCLKRGVDIRTQAVAADFEIAAGQVQGVVTNEGRVRADRYCLAAGAWSGTLAATLGLRLETRPIRGQIALLRLPRQVLTRVVNLGLDYLVPRDDGRLLVGSTIEDAGFDATTTADAVERLLHVAARLLGELPGAHVEQAWAGLRPGSADGLPSLGRVPGLSNAYVAAGHFRAGLHQSTGTAVLLADLITGTAPAIDPAPFDPARSIIPEEAPRGSVADYLARAAAEGV